MVVPVPAPRAGRVLLVGWDAADWQVIHPLLDAGRMPHLQRLVDGGAMGNLQSLQPMLSPILWTSIATGKRAYGHGVHGFIEPTPDRAGVRFAAGRRATPPRRGPTSGRPPRTPCNHRRLRKG